MQKHKSRYFVLFLLSCILVLTTTFVFAGNEARSVSGPLTGDASDTTAANIADAAQNFRFLTGPNDGEPLAIAITYLHEHAADFGLTSAEVDGLIVTDQYASAHNGVTHIYLRQSVNDIEVYGANSAVHVSEDGAVIAVIGDFTPDLAANVTTASLQLTAVDAATEAADHLGVTVSEPIEIEQRGRSNDQVILLSDGGFSQISIPAKLVYQPLENNELRLAWDLVIDMVETPDYWNLRVDAETGEVLSQDNWTNYDSWGPAATSPANTSLPVAAPMHSTMATPDDANFGEYQVYAIPLRDPAEGDRSVVSGVDDPIASPYGWHDVDGVLGPEYQITRGNNVHAYADPFNINVSSGDEPDGGPNLLFGFPIDLNQDPTTYTDASVTNLFYVNNVIHDIFYQYGFDEVSGNFQANNYGNGGLGDDWVRAEAQDGGGFTNANFATPADGFLPRMQMYLGGPDEITGVNRDGSLDNHVVIHEYGHGISNRLVGGPSTAGCLGGAEQGGEGWSDWFGLALIADPGDTGAMPITVGNWLAGQSPAGTGFRPFPYSTSFLVNPSTYDSIKDAGTFSQPHGIGTIWASMIWDMYWNLVDRDGFDPDLYNGTGGNNLAIQLVVDGLKYTACNPTFTDQRDGVLMADLVNNPITPTPAAGFPQSENECLIWESFATRGLGYSADDGGTTGRFDGTEAFDMPPQCWLDPVTPSFEVSAAPISQEICSNPAQDAVYDVEISSFLGFNDNVTLSTSGEPAGTTVGFSPNGSAAPYTSTLTIGNTGAAAAGSYTIDIIGSDTGMGVYTATVGLDVTGAVPSVVTLASPADASTGISPISALNLAWNAASGASSYTVEVAEDAGFATIVFTNTVTSLSTTIPQGTLDANQTYHWRVTASNLCGSAMASSTFTFSTRAIGNVLFVDADSDIFADSGFYFTDALDELSGVVYDVWDAGFINSDDPPSTILTNYTAVVWSGGELLGIGPAGEAEMASYLDGGGCLFISAQDYHYNYGLTSFMQSYLGVQSVIDDVGHTAVAGQGVLSVLGPYNLSFPPTYSGNWSDDLTPDGTAALAFSGNASNGRAAISKDNGTYRTTFWGFPFEAIPSSAERASAMVNTLNWCAPSLSAELSAISLEKTVGLDAGSCSTADSLIVPTGTDVTYCYTVTNLGSSTYITHTLVDDQLGSILSDFPLSLGPGTSAFVTDTATINSDITNTGVWTATVSSGSSVMAMDTASVNTITTPLSYDSCLDFESGTLPDSMTAQVTSSGGSSGRVQVSSSDPFNGSYALALDTDISGNFTQQAAVLMVDLNGQSDVELNFWVKEYGDENHAPDGVFISDDNGTTFTQILSLNNFPATYVNIQIDLDEAAANAGLTLTDQFLIKFQSYDNFSIPSDGYMFDDICVQPGSPSFINSSKSAPAEAIFGDVFTYTVAINNSGLTAATGATMVDPIPLGVDYMSGSVSATSGVVSYNGGTNAIEWVGNVGVNETVEVSFAVEVTATVGAIITNTATIDHSGSISVNVSTYTDITDAIPRINVDQTQTHQTQSSNEVVSRTLSISNDGFADLNWTVHETDCATPVDIPWLSITPTSGTLARGSQQDLELTFDSAGLAPAIYTENICFASNDPDAPELDIEITLVVFDGYILYLPVIYRN